MAMGVRFSHQKNPSPLIVSMTPKQVPKEPLSPKGSLGREAVVTMEPIKPPTSHADDPIKPTMVHTGSKSSLVSNSSTSPPVRGKLPRRVSFDLLAEMAYSFPEQPLSPVLVELSGDVTVVEEEEIVDFCDGSDSESVDAKGGGGSHEEGGDGGVGGGKGKKEGEGGGGDIGKLRLSAKQNVIHPLALICFDLVVVMYEGVVCDPSNIAHKYCTL